MGRQKTIRQLEAQLRYARAREAYEPPVREPNGSIQNRPKIGVRYQQVTPISATDVFFTYQASAAGVRFFGGLATLNLQDAGTDAVMPKECDPAMVLAMIADANPQTERSRASGRPYIRYARGNRGSNVQNSFRAPISAESPSALMDKVKAVLDSKKDEVGGGYGRLWFEPERILIVQSGNVQ